METEAQMPHNWYHRLRSELYSWTMLDAKPYNAKMFLVTAILVTLFWGPAYARQ